MLFFRDQKFGGDIPVAPVVTFNGDGLRVETENGPRPVLTIRGAEFYPVAHIEPGHEAGALCLINQSQTVNNDPIQEDQVFFAQLSDHLRYC